MTEDLGIFADQQQGLSTSRHKGVIGTREERIYAFQKYLLEKQGRWPKQESELTEMSLAGE